MRLGFQLLYNQMAWSYDLVSWVVSLGQWRQWQRAGLAHVSGHQVLELAPGPGHMLLELSRRGFRAVGLDLSPYMGHIARGRLDRLGETASVLRGRAEALPFADDTFDAVLATFPTEFIVDPATISGLRRVLRSGGRLVIVPEARLTAGGPLRPIIEWLYVITGQRQGPLDPAGPSQLWQEARRRYEAAGFRIELVQTTLPGSIATVVLATAGVGSNRSRLVQ